MEILCIAVRLYSLVIFLRIILSWLTMFTTPPGYLTPAIRVIFGLTEPVLGPLRRAIPPMGGFDFSPLIVVLVLQWFVAPALCSP